MEIAEVSIPRSFFRLKPLDFGSGLATETTDAGPPTTSQFSRIGVPYKGNECVLRCPLFASMFLAARLLRVGCRISFYRREVYAFLRTSNFNE